jgi:hypothetical protein
VQDFNLDVLGGKNSSSDEKWKIATVETLAFQVFGQASKLQVFGDLGLEVMLQNLWKFCEINLTFIWVIWKIKIKKSYK